MALQSPLCIFAAFSPSDGQLSFIDDDDDDGVAVSLAGFVEVTKGISAACVHVYFHYFFFINSIERAF